MTKSLETLTDSISAAQASKHGRIEFRIELGRGTTYANDDWTIYALDSYARSSVLAGRERRRWIGSTGPGPAGKELAIAACKAAGVWRQTTVDDCGSSYTPIDQIVSHLPDNEA